VFAVAFQNLALC
jgi:hypothetical protein